MTLLGVWWLLITIIHFLYFLSSDHIVVFPSTRLTRSVGSHSQGPGTLSFSSMIDPVALIPYSVPCVSVCTRDWTDSLLECCPVFDETEACFLRSDVVNEEQKHLDKTIG